MSQQWIPFTLETFKEINTDVLFLTSAGAIVGQVRPDSVNKRLDGSAVGPTVEEVTHWAPLPRGMAVTQTDVEARSSVSKAALRLASLINNAYPDQAAWVLAVEMAYQELLDTVANAADPRRKLLQDEVQFLRDLTNFPLGPLLTPADAVTRCAELLNRLASAYEGLPGRG